MARTIQQIQTKIVSDMKTNLPQWTNTSSFSFLLQITYVVAVAIALLEQIMDVFRIDVNAIIDKIPPNTFVWLQDKIINLFQYDSTIPQVLMLQTDITKSNYLQPYYVTPDSTKNIVKQVSVTNSITIGQLNIKALGANRVILNTNQINSLVLFLNTIGVPGITYKVISILPDYLAGAITIFYNKNYDKNNIQTYFNSFYNEYVSNIDYNGSFVLSDFIEKLKMQPFVNDILIQTLVVNTNGGVPIYTLVQNSQVNNPPVFVQTETSAGYFSYNTNQILITAI